MDNHKTEQLFKQYQTENKIKTLFKIFRIRTLLHKSGIKKESGVSVSHIFYNLFLLAFYGCGINGMFNHKTPEGFNNNSGKDVYYRFMNNPKNNWRKFLYKVTLNIIKSLKKWKGKNSVNYLIIDDTSRHKRGKKIEFSGYFFDHVLKKTVWGMVDLFLGWSDGKTFLPIDFAIKGGSGYKKEVVKQNVDKRTSGGKRRKEALCKKTSLMLSMLKRAYTSGIDASYVMFDSWFAFPMTISSIYNLGYNIICRVKKMKTIKYSYKDKLLTVDRLYKIAKKTSKKLKYKQYVISTLDTAIIDKENKSRIPVRLVFSYSCKLQQYEVWLTTDIDINSVEILSHYEKRWEIEAFFKVMKQYFRLGKEHSNSFEAIIGFTTLCCIRYSLLAFYKRESEDIYTIDSVFYSFRNTSYELASLSKVVDVLKKCFEILSSSLFFDSSYKNGVMKVIDTLMSFLFVPVDLKCLQGCET